MDVASNTFLCNIGDLPWMVLFRAAQGVMQRKSMRRFLSDSNNRHWRCVVISGLLPLSHTMQHARPEVHTSVKMLLGPLKHSPCFLCR